MLIALVVCLALSLTADPAKKPAPKPAAPEPIAPESLPHPMALFLRSLSNDGGRQVTFKATAVGIRFFIEEPAGVTVYTYDGTGYRKETFVEKATLPKVVATYASR